MQTLRRSHSGWNHHLPPVRCLSVLPSPVVDNGGLGWGILGCCIPIVGLVLWLVWKDQKPRTAKAAGIGALVAVGLGALYYVLIFMLGIGIVLGS